MKNFIITIVILFLTASGSTFAQKNFYFTTGGEMIFSFAPDIDNNGTPGNGNVRWTPWFNVQSFGNYDFNKFSGAIFGLAIRNVGYIDENSDPNNTTMKIKKKYRTYNLGIPAGLKFGILDKFFIYGGYEIEFPLTYKEKTFINGEKHDNKIKGWFTGRNPCCFHTVFAAIQLPFGMSIKYKYYLTNFFNEDFSEIFNGTEIYPYKGKQVNIMYLSVSFTLFRNAKFDTADYELNRENTEVY
jgi:hypothetical protein